MAIGIILGITLVMIGLALLGHLSYLNYDTSTAGAHSSSGEAGMICPEDPTSSFSYKTGKAGLDGKINDCPLPLCFFRISSVANHETWIVAFLLGGSAVLSLSLAIGY